MTQPVQDKPTAAAGAQQGPEELAARNRRNMWLGLSLAAFVVIVGLVTFIRLSEADLSKGGFYYSVDAENEQSDALPPGMSPDEAAPPPNLTQDPEPAAEAPQ